MSQLVERLTRLGLHEAAQIVSRYEQMAADLHAERQKNVELRKMVDRIERKTKGIPDMLRSKVQGKSTEHDAGVRYAAQLIEKAL